MTACMFRKLGMLVVGALLLAGCGSARDSRTTPAAISATATAPVQAPPTPFAISGGKPALDELRAAEHPRVGEFPGVQGRTLEQLARLSTSTAQLSAATGFSSLGRSRYAFGLNAAGGGFIYAPTAVYLATAPSAPAVGPFLAPADPMAVGPQYRSEQNDPFVVKAAYDAQVPLAHQGVYAVLVLTRGPGGLIASSSEIAVATSSPIPAVGERPPDIATDTLASVHGNISLLTTRTPPDDMHAVSFNQVLGKRPIALLFSTPALCVSRVCGPVTDIMVELEHEPQFAGRIVFIHEEVYVDNDPAKGLRPQLKAFHLETEPWLFTFDREGVIAARLDGAFGVAEARAALEAALS
jgi:hypothetical protein